MTRQDLLNFHGECCARMYRILRAKNSDYAGDSGPFKNFQLIERLGLCSTETGILVRMTDKVSRLSNLLSKGPQVKDESVQDTLLDLANYSIILAAYLKEKKK